MLLAWLAPQRAELGDTHDSATAAKPEAPDTPTIAVLPFRTSGGDDSQAYLSNGLSEDIIGDLSTLDSLRVIARNSSFAYRGATADLAQIGRELNADYVLGGGLDIFDDTVSLQVQLTDVAAGDKIWAESFDAPIGDVLEIQDRVMAGMVSALPVTLTSAEIDSLTQSYTDNPQAYEQFLKGQNAFLQFMTDRLDEARFHFNQAIALDPSFARAYSALAATYANEVLQGVAANAEASLAQAIELAQKALDLDEELPQAHFVRGYAQAYRGDYQSAIASMETALSLAPSYADAYLLLAFIYIHADSTLSAFPLIRQGMRLNPSYPLEYLLILAMAQYWQGDLEASRLNLEKAVERNPSYLMLKVQYTATLSRLGWDDDAAWQAEEVLALHPDFSVRKWVSEQPYKHARQSEQIAEDLHRAGLPD